MNKDLKNKIDSIRRTLKNNSLEISGTVIESKILELCPNHEGDWNSDIRAEVIKSVTQTHNSSEIVSAIAPMVNASPVQESLSQYQESETSTEQEIEDEELNAIPSPDNEVSHAIALQDKSDKVASTAESMGIELHLNEVTNIASNLDYSGDSLFEGIDDIRSAITAFVEYKAQINQQKINHMIGEVRATVNQRNQETSQHLNNSLSQIAKDINQADTDFKSTVRQALKCFAIPANKAG
jgi:hypothetical protein